MKRTCNTEHCPAQCFCCTQYENRDEQAFGNGQVFGRCKRWTRRTPFTGTCDEFECVLREEKNDEVHQ